MCVTKFSKTLFFFVSDVIIKKKKQYHNSCLTTFCCHPRSLSDDIPQITEREKILENVNI